MELKGDYIINDLPPDIYYVNDYFPIDQFIVSIMEKGGQAIYFDLAKIADKHQLLTAFAHQFNFPDYFGDNWDALADCLAEEDYLNHQLYGIVLDNYDRWGDEQLDNFNILIEILHQTIDHWRDQNTSIYIICRLNSIVPD